MKDFKSFSWVISPMVTSNKMASYCTLRCLSGPRARFPTFDHPIRDVLTDAILELLFSSAHILVGTRARKEIHNTRRVFILKFVLKLGIEGSSGFPADDDTAIGVDFLNVSPNPHTPSMAFFLTQKRQTDIDGVFWTSIITIIVIVNTAR